MDLFFDSGATKCDAILLDDNGRYLRHCTSEGINATYMSDSDIRNILEGLRDQTGSEFRRITFCGAGCGNPDNATRIQTILQELYNINIRNIEVISDLVGACRLLCDGQSGMVAILGTGASACLYDGSRIVVQAPSLGYLLGDEGSGTYLGKLFIQKYLREELPAPIAANFERTYGFDKAEVIRRIYRESAPNRFLASFAHYLGENRDIPELRNILTQGFTDFFLTQIGPLQPYNICILHLMGSVAYHFRDIIGEIAQKNGCSLGNLAASPLDFFQKQA